MTISFKVAATAAIVATAGTASAALISYEGFDYSPGDVQGQSGGTGYSAAWEAQDGFSYAVNPGSLQSGGLETSGNHLGGGNSYRSLGRRLATGNGSSFADAGLVSDVWTTQFIDQGTLFVSFLMRKDGNDTSYVAFSDSNTPWFHTNDRLQIGNDFRWGVKANGASAYSNLDPVVGETVFVVARIAQTLGQSTSVDVWFNPDSLGGTPPPPTVSLTDISHHYTRFKSLAFYGGNGTGQSSLDEIRFGTSYADVTPEAVPEPGTLAALAAGAAAMALRRRRKA